MFIGPPLAPGTIIFHCLVTDFHYFASYAKSLRFRTNRLLLCILRLVNFKYYRFGYHLPYHVLKISFMKVSFFLRSRGLDLGFDRVASMSYGNEYDSDVWETYEKTIPIQSWTAGALQMSTIGYSGCGRYDRRACLPELERRR